MQFVRVVNPDYGLYTYKYIGILNMERIFFKTFCQGTSKYKIGNLHNLVADFE